MLKKPNEVRIIAGLWRGKKIHFPPVEGLRPTPDRVRETLFNWISHDIYNSRCLDLFAGSGVLGFEALSRGAREVTFVESNPVIAVHLKQLLKTLAPTKGAVLEQDALKPLKFINPGYDIIFLDPPYERDIIKPVCELILSENYLRPGGIIYIEAEKDLTPLPIPSSWTIVRQKTAGLVGYSLVRGS